MTREAQKEEESTESREQKHQVEVVEVKPPALEVSPADAPKGSFEQKAEQDVGAAGVKVESVKTQEQISTEKKVQKIVSQNLEASASTPEIKKESKAPRVGPESSSTKASKKDESAGPESSLVRWLRSHTPQQKASSSEADPKSNTESNAHRQKKRKKHAKASVKDDASRIKMRVRYLLNRINREQNLIDVYSADGWKGQSLEKLRPEQELKRAERQILRCKLGIRQELQQLHTLSLEGSIQDTAFDPEGQIYFDDIFCAICKSKEVLPENDIILCDGACNRAFHQFCLEPPLRTEDIPPGDDGWLCPICDCKFDCLDAINDHLGTDFEMEDNWEKVFAEAEDVAHAGDNLVGSLVDWPSEDSEDDDYNPEKAKLSEHDGSARESGSNDADDSDSDLDSDSDSDSDSNSSDNSSGVVFFDEFAGTARGKKRPLSEDDETEELLREHVEEDAVLVSGKRQRMDIDYKQLYDEVYGAYASDYDSSEDEDWGKKKQSKGLKESDQHMEGSVSEAKQGKGKNGEVFEAVDVSQRKKSPMKLPTEVVAKLQEIFNECELPSKARKQALSSQMGLPFADVNTWFKNARRTASRKKKLGEGGNASGLSSDSGAQPAGKEESVCTGTTRHETAGD